MDEKLHPKAICGCIELEPEDTIMMSQSMTTRKPAELIIRENFSRLITVWSLPMDTRSTINWTMNVTILTSQAVGFMPKEVLPTVPSDGKTAKALNYCLNQEKYLRVFLKNGNVEMDNNRAEQAIRPFTIGRKNWVFHNSIRGAQASACIYSIVETAKANGIKTYDYLNLLLEEIPQRLEDNDNNPNFIHKYKKTLGARLDGGL